MSVDRPIDVCHLVGSIGYGGRETLLLELFRNCPEDVSFTLCSLRVGDPELVAEFENIGVDVVNVEAESRADVGALWHLFRYLRREDFDILHSHGMNSQIPGRILGKLGGVTHTVSTFHGLRTMKNNRLLPIEQATRRLDSACISVSDGVQRSFVGDGGCDMWRTIYNGIDVEGFNKRVERSDVEDLRSRYGINEGELVYLNVGRYIPKEAQGDLIDAMKQVTETHPDSRLFVVGGRGPLEDELQEQVAENGLEDSVEITRKVRSVEEYYALADVFVSSSVKEGLGIVLIEAMAAKIPVIARSIPGVDEVVVNDESGLLASPESPDGLAEAMTVLRSTEKRTTIADAGYERAKRVFNIEKTVDEHIDLYANLVA
jgi:glycosyltransferase involved in cell wall biosynthesis